MAGKKEFYFQTAHYKDTGIQAMSFYILGVVESFFSYWLFCVKGVALAIPKQLPSLHTLSYVKVKR